MIFLHDGVIEAQGSPEDVLDGGSQRVRKFLGRGAEAAS
jgi:ABC-type histidine transport system ATPase subunit